MEEKEVEEPKRDVTLYFGVDDYVMIPLTSSEIDELVQMKITEGLYVSVDKDTGQQVILDLRKTTQIVIDPPEAE